MDKAKQKLLDKLGKKGFDTEKKVNAIDMQVAFDNGLADEIGGILALQKAIKTHTVYAFLMIPPFSYSVFPSFNAYSVIE